MRLRLGASRCVPTPTCPCRPCNGISTHSRANEVYPFAYGALKFGLMHANLGWSTDWFTTACLHLQKSSLGWPEAVLYSMGASQVGLRDSFSFSASRSSTWRSWQCITLKQLAYCALGFLRILRLILHASTLLQSTYLLRWKAGVED